MKLRWVLYLALALSLVGFFFSIIATAIGLI